jgi:hypothetical protein
MDLLLFQDKSFVVCPEICSEGVRLALELEVSTLRLFHKRRAPEVQWISRLLNPGGSRLPINNASMTAAMLGDITNTSCTSNYFPQDIQNSLWSLKELSHTPTEFEAQWT